MSKLYRKASLTDDQKDTFVFQHVTAMTGEKLYYKSEIAFELGVRDCRIAELEKDIAFLQSCVNSRETATKADRPSERAKALTEGNNND
jgi:hypothetical protein